MPDNACHDIYIYTVDYGLFHPIGEDMKMDDLSMEDGGIKTIVL